jgi:hypothetical protein
VTADTGHASRQRAAKVAGIAYLLSLPFVIFAHFGISARLIVTGDAAATARNIVAHERLFRVGIVCNLLYAAGVFVLLAALHVILKRVDENLSLVAACGRLVYAVVWVVMTLNLFTVLRLLKGPDFAQVLGAGQTPVLARIFLSGFDAYYVALLFYGLGATVSSYLWFKIALHPSSARRRERDLEPVVRGVHSRLPHRPRLHEGRESVVVRFTHGHFRDHNESLAPVQGIEHT